MGDQRFLGEMGSAFVDVDISGRGGEGERSTFDGEVSTWDLWVVVEGDFISDCRRNGVLWGGGIGGIWSSILSSSFGSGEGSRGNKGLDSIGLSTGFSDSVSEN